MQAAGVCVRWVVTACHLACWAMLILLEIAWLSLWRGPSATKQALEDVAAMMRAEGWDKP